MKKMNWILWVVLSLGCVSTEEEESLDAEESCVFCGDEKADAFGISRSSYLAYGIVDLANTASFKVLDDDVRLDRRAASGIVATRPFDYIEQIDTVSYVGRRAFSRLAEYAEAQGFVPFCGDGKVQSLLEACDDGNQNNGDGCSSTCLAESGGQNTSFFETDTHFIKGSQIGVSFVNPNGFYLRERRYKGFGLASDIKAILDRADGILANSTANDRVSYDELALLSKEPFLSSLFSSERNALVKAWKIFEINSAEPVVIRWEYGSVPTSVAFDFEVLRPGPIEVISVRQISSLGSFMQTIARRLQQMNGLNADNNSRTIEMGDLEAGLGNYRPVFTQSELNEMQRLLDDYIQAATPSFGGDYMVKYSTMPSPSKQTFRIADFDGWTYNAYLEVDVHYDAYDKKSIYSGNYVPDANLKSEYSFWTSLHKPGLRRPLKWMKLNGDWANGGSERGYRIMERWENGRRKYNRVLKFESTFYRVHKQSSYKNEFATARPMLADGTPLSLRKSTTVQYGRNKRYQRFKLAKVQSHFNKNIEKFFPNSADRILSIPFGRYEAVDGVVIDVHKSGAIFAYIGGCELPFSIQDGTFETKSCGGRSAKIDVDRSRAFLKLYSGGRKTKEVQLYNSSNPHLAIDLDRTYYIVK